MATLVVVISPMMQQFVLHLQKIVQKCMTTFLVPPWRGGLSCFEGFTRSVESRHEVLGVGPISSRTFHPAIVQELTRHADKGHIHERLTIPKKKATGKI